MLRQAPFCPDKEEVEEEEEERCTSLGIKSAAEGKAASTTGCRSWEMERTCLVSSPSFGVSKVGQHQLRVEATWARDRKTSSSVVGGVSGWVGG